MEDRETARMRKYGESKTTRIMMATVPHVISSLGLRKFQADGFLLTRMYQMAYLRQTSLPKSCMYLSLPHAGHLSPPLHSTYFYNPNNFFEPLKSQISSSNNCLQPPLTSSISGQNISLSILFSNTFSLYSSLMWQTKFQTHTLLKQQAKYRHITYKNHSASIYET